MELDRRLSQAINWAHRKKIDLAAGAVLSAAAFACSGGNGKSETNPTPLGPDIPPVATATQVPPTEVPPTPTPEAPKFTFGHYYVFAGDIEGGGKVVIASFVDGLSTKYCVNVSKDQPRATNGFYVFNFTKGSVSSDKTSFNIEAGTKKRITGKLIDAQTVTGTMTQEGYQANQAGNPFTFPNASANYTAVRVGNGLRSLLDSYRKAIVEGLSIKGAITDDQLIGQLQSGCNVTIPQE